MTERARNTQTVKYLIRRVERRLRAAGLHFGHGTESARDEAAWLVAHVARVAPHRLEAHLDRNLTAAQARRAQALVEARIATRKPLAYLIHEAWFAGLRFYVDERVIVPRSLTAEFIRERFAPWVEAARVRRILDLCTGSGCMAVALARAFPRARVDAADISPAALAVARINVRRHRRARRVRLIESDLYARLGERRYDVIVTNPPYVARAELETLPAEYRHEPALALAAGASGLDAVTRILAEAAAHLNPGGILVAEVGGSAAALQEKFPSVPFLWLSTASGDESVFLLTDRQLVEHQTTFASRIR
jgi:ribosomal protein L3 glutamine methyltransferase